MASATFPATRRSFAFERISGISTAAVVTLTAATYGHYSATGDNRVPARAAIISVEVDSIRYTTDGTTPTTGASGVGHRANPDDVITLEGLQEIKNFKMIGETATAVVSVTYLR